jgi:hypothetical protein
MIVLQKVQDHQLHGGWQCPTSIMPHFIIFQQLMQISVKQYVKNVKEIIIQNLSFYCTFLGANKGFNNDVG